MDDAIRAAEETARRYAAAAEAKDLEAFLALYDPRVRVYDAWGRWSHEGQDAWREAVAAWFGSLGSEGVSIEFDGLSAGGSGDAAFASAFVVYAGLSEGGDVLHSMRNRLSWGLLRGPEGWLIVHEHTSAPIDFESGKAMLE